ncbi:MAG: hypothetical protein ABJB12_15265 [Pseudomonadota bacterium]
MPWARARSFAGKLFRSEVFWVAILAGLSILIHAKYRVTGLGEQDAARLARDAAVWHIKQQLWLNETTYRMRTSAGYIHLLKLALDHGLRIARLPALMNWSSVILGTGTGVALYALFRQFSAPRHAAVALFLYEMTPGFWLGNIYGMPTIPALGMFALSVLLFVRATRVPELKSARLAALILGAFACLFAAVSFKADLCLCTGVFVLAALYVPGRRVPMLALASFVVLGAVYANSRYAASLISLTPADHVSTREFLKDWNTRIPFKQDALFDPTNSGTIVHCVGPLLFCMLLLALLAALVAGGKRRWVAISALTWAVPPILFWALSFGNNARHNVFGMAPLFLVASQFLFKLTDERTVRAVVLTLGVAALAYWSDTSSHGTISPGTNLARAAAELEDTTQSIHARGRRLAATPSNKRVVVGSGVFIPYLSFEILAAAKTPILVNAFELHDGAQVTLFADNTGRRQRVETQRRYRVEGFTFLSQ